MSELAEQRGDVEVEGLGTLAYWKPGERLLARSGLWGVDLQWKYAPCHYQHTTTQRHEVSRIMLYVLRRLPSLQPPPGVDAVP